MVFSGAVQQFIDWTKRKIFHHFDDGGKRLYFREREVWWAALGKNVGYEVDGKHELFERPVVIIKKYSKDMCFVLPLTTQIKANRPWYHFIVQIDGTPNAINISQGRAISKKRLLRRMTMIDGASYDEMLEKFTKQFKNKK